MKVFISWSGELSRDLAETLRDWFPEVIQVVETFFTPEDIEKGDVWETQIADHLEKCDVGVLVMTPGNTTAPWLMFEAGALSKHKGKARVCPILFGLTIGQLKGPLTKFQSTLFTRDEMLKLMQNIRKFCDDARITEALVDKAFDRVWPEFEKKVKQILVEGEKGAPSEKKPAPEAMLEEILRHCRMIPQLSAEMKSTTTPQSGLASLPASVSDRYQDRLRRRMPQEEAEARILHFLSSRRPLFARHEEVSNYFKGQYSRTFVAAILDHMVDRGVLRRAIDQQGTVLLGLGEAPVAADGPPPSDPIASDNQAPPPQDLQEGELPQRSEP